MNAIVPQSAFGMGYPVNNALNIVKLADGQTVAVLKAQPTESDVHVNSLLTNISVACIQDASRFVAARVFPSIPVNKQSDVYASYDRSFFTRSEMQVRAPGTETSGIGYSIDMTNTYYAPVYGIHHDIDDQVRSNADTVIQPDRDATLLLTHQALLKEEIAWVSTYFTTGVWTNDKTGVASAPGANQFLQWNNASSTPIEDIREYKRTIAELTGFEPNKLVLGRAVYDALVDHPDIVDRIKGGSSTGNPAIVNLRLLAQLFEVEEVLVANAIKNTADEGQTASYSFIAGKAALLCYTTATPGVMTPTAGYTFKWTGYIGASRQGTRMLKYRMPSIRSDRIEMESSFVHKVVMADLGLFMTTAVA